MVLPNTNNRYLPWLILSGLAIVWGSSFILIKYGLQSLTDQEVGALRILFTFFAFIPFAVRNLHKVKKKDWKYLLITGFIGSAAPAFLFAKAQTGIDSNLAGILNSLTPLFTFLLGAAFFRLKYRWYNVAGIFFGLAGAAGLLSVSGGKTLEFNLSYGLYVLAATICYAINVNVIKRYLSEMHAFLITVYSFFLTGLPVLLYFLFATAFISRLPAHPEMMQGVLYILILSLIGTAMALIFFNRLVQLKGPVFASSVTYLIPLVALFWGILDGEVFKLWWIAWIGLIITGLMLVNKKAK